MNSDEVDVISKTFSNEDPGGFADGNVDENVGVETEKNVDVPQKVINDEIPKKSEHEHEVVQEQEVNINENEYKQDKEQIDTHDHLPQNSNWKDLIHELILFLHSPFLGLWLQIMLLS